MCIGNYYCLDKVVYKLLWLISWRLAGKLLMLGAGGGRRASLLLRALFVESAHAPLRRRQAPSMQLL